VGTIIDLGIASPDSWYTGTADNRADNVGVYTRDPDVGKITTGDSDFYQLQFSGLGGQWTFLDAATSTATTTITQGTLRHGGSNDIVLSDFVIQTGSFFEKATGTGRLYFEDTSDPIIIEDQDENNNLGDVYVGFSPATTNQNSDIVVDSLTINSGDTHNTGGYEIDCAGDITIYGTLNATDSRENDLTNISLGGSWLVSGGTFTHGNSTTTFDATTTGKTITDGGSAFYDLVFNGTGGGWFYADSTSTEPNSLTVQNGTSTFLNAKTGTNISVTGGQLNVDWYLGIHVVAAESTSTDIANATCTISESSTTPQSTIWKMSSGSWGMASTSQYTLTQTGTATGTNPQPTSDGAIRLREYSQNSVTSTYYRYNLQVEASAFSIYDYYADHGSNYIISSSTLETSNVDKCISQDWHRATPSSLNGTKDYDGLNEKPDSGTWYAGMSSDLEFSVDSSSVNLGNLNQANTYTATNTTMLYTTTSYSGGYTVKAYATNQGRLNFSSYYIIRWPYSNSAPQSWLGTCEGSAECGFGYTTDDNNLGGGTSSRFNNATNYAGFATTTPGDTVADETTAVPSGSQHTITYKVSAPALQEAGIYDTTVYYICTVNY
jgi:hypothetical protein